MRLHVIASLCLASVTVVPVNAWSIPGAPIPPLEMAYQTCVLGAKGTFESCVADVADQFDGSITRCMMTYADDVHYCECFKSPLPGWCADQCAVKYDRCTRDAELHLYDCQEWGVGNKPNNSCSDYYAYDQCMCAHERDACKKMQTPNPNITPLNRCLDLLPNPPLAPAPLGIATTSPSGSAPTGSPAGTKPPVVAAPTVTAPIPAGMPGSTKF